MPVEDYELDPQPLARGSQGSVYVGTRRSDGLHVAVKVTPAETQMAKALLREMELLRRLADAGVTGTVVCLEGMRIGDQLAMVMPRYDRTLSKWLAEVIQLPGQHALDDILTRITELARILADIHKLDYQGQTVIHRDIKPENVFLDGQGRPHIGDFGGAMAIGGLERVELALFGTPMWAPLDQILPGETIPDPTWDTYALCVLLYAAVTGARPAYQADPTELLTEKGRALWNAARSAVESTGADRKQWHRAFAELRKTSSSSDIVDFTGRAALLDSDRLALNNGLASLFGLARIRDPTALPRLQRGLWAILVRGLSPLSHPSPPNRYRDGLELADDLEDLRDLLYPAHTPAPRPPPETPAPVRSLSAAAPTPTPSPALGEHVVRLTTELDKPASTLSAGSPVLGAVVGVLLVGGVLAALWLGRDAIRAALLDALPADEVVQIEAGETQLGGEPLAVAAFAMDRTEVSVSAWESCVQTGACPPLRRDLAPTQPAVGLRFEEAAAYCTSVGGRLPTEAEFSRALGDAPWPWGTEPPTCAHATALGCGSEPTPVGSTPRGTSSEGARDLVGNAWEWVTSEDGSGVLVGGALDSPASQLGRNGRLVPDPKARPPLAGVRCAY